MVSVSLIGLFVDSYQLFLLKTAHMNSNPLIVIVKKGPTNTYVFLSELWTQSRKPTRADLLLILYGFATKLAQKHPFCRIELFMPVIGPAIITISPGR